MERFSRMGQIRPVDLERTGSLGRVYHPEDLGGTPVRIASARMEKARGAALRRGTVCIKEVPHNARRSRLSLDPGNAREVPWSSLIHRRDFTRGGQSPFRLQLCDRCGRCCTSRRGGSGPAAQMVPCIRTAVPGCPRAREEHAAHAVVSSTNGLSLVYGSLHVSILQEAEMMLNGADAFQFLFHCIYPD